MRRVHEMFLYCQPVSDLDACAQSWVVATGLQDWIRQQASIDRGDNK